MPVCTPSKKKDRQLSRISAQRGYLNAKNVSSAFGDHEAKIADHSANTIFYQVDTLRGKGLTMRVRTRERGQMEEPRNRGGAEKQKQTGRLRASFVISVVSRLPYPQDGPQSEQRPENDDPSRTKDDNHGDEEDSNGTSLGKRRRRPDQDGNSPRESLLPAYGTTRLMRRVVSAGRAQFPDTRERAIIPPQHIRQDPEFFFFLFFSLPIRASKKRVLSAAEQICVPCSHANCACVEC